MTLRVNRDIGFQVVASTHEFPEGGAAVSLDGGSHFYEHQIVKGFPLELALCPTACLAVIHGRPAGRPVSTTTPADRG